jgi:hypothetical protein
MYRLLLYRSVQNNMQVTFTVLNKERKKEKKNVDS